MAGQQAGDEGTHSGGCDAVQGGRGGGCPIAGVEAMIESKVSRYSMRIDLAIEDGLGIGYEHGRQCGGGRLEGYGHDAEAMLANGSAVEALPAVTGVEEGGDHWNLHGLSVDADVVISEAAVMAQAPCVECAVTA